MKIRKGFVLREMCGEHIVSAEGIDNFDFNKVISLNDSAAWLWEAVSGKDFDADTLTGLLLAFRPLMGDKNGQGGEAS